MAGKDRKQERAGLWTAGHGGHPQASQAVNTGRPLSLLINGTYMEKLVLKKKSGYSVSCVKEIPEACRGIVVAVHGFSSNKECPTFQVLLGKLPQAGLGMVGMDLPGHGKEESLAETLGLEACKESISAVEEYIKASYPSMPIYYFGSSYGAYVVGLYISTREHEGRKAFFRSGAVNMPELFIKENPSAEEQEKLKELAGKGYFYYSLDDDHQPVKITQGFYDDLAGNDLFELFDPGRYGDNKVSMAHGLEDSVIHPEKARAFAQKYGIPVHFYGHEGHSLGNVAEEVVDQALHFFIDG